MKQRTTQKIRQIVRLLLVFGSGLVSGLLLEYGMVTLEQRDGLPGGEALILPLIILLVCLGWQLGGLWHER